MKVNGTFHDIWKARVWYFFMAPTFLLFILFFLYPILESARLSFYSTDLNFEKLVWFKNYADVIADKTFWYAVYNTLYMAFFHVAIGVPLAIFLAVILNKRIRGQGFLRVIYYLPVVTSIVAISVVWSYLFDVNYGPLNYLLKFIGLPASPWITDPSTSKISVVLMTVWHGLGYRMVIALAGLQSIPEQLYEAARVDGANRRQQFWSITLPMLQPTIAFLIITSTITALQRFDEVYMFGTELGLPARSLSTMVLYLYEHGFGYNEFGWASAAAYLLFLLILGITLVNLRVTGKDKAKEWW